MDRTGEITALLSRLHDDGGNADQRLIDELMPLVYGELKALARANRYRWKGRSSPETTSLVHEVYYKLARQDGAEFESRRQFFYIASRAMRSILIDNARRRSRQRRGGGLEPLPLDEARLVSEERSGELIALDEALSRLEANEEGPRPGGRVPDLRRFDDRRDGRHLETFSGDREAKVAACPYLALP